MRQLMKNVMRAWRIMLLRRCWEEVSPTEKRHRGFLVGYRTRFWVKSKPVISKDARATPVITAALAAYRSSLFGQTSRPPCSVVLSTVEWLFHYILSHHTCNLAFSFLLSEVPYGLERNYRNGISGCRLSVMCPSWLCSSRRSWVHGILLGVSQAKD